jgi:hypothetical protein
MENEMAKKQETTVEQQDAVEQPSAGNTSPNNEKVEGETAPSASLIKVYCKLPHGIEFSAGKVKVALNGAYHKNAVAGFGITEVDAETWGVIEKTYAKHPAITRQLIFAQERDGEAKAKELEKEKTGFERLNPNAPSTGVVPEKP